MDRDLGYAALALTNFIIFFAGGSFDLMMPTYILLTKCYPLSILYVLIWYVFLAVFPSVNE